MCGICGIIEFNNIVERPILEKMLDTLIHRGPDDSGIYINKNIGLGHRRLSIIDLEFGKQPMTDNENYLTLIYNGEIYNFFEIKEILFKKGHKFKTQSDAEVLLYAYKEWGIDCLNYINGMFAFAIWDEKKNQLFIARDQIGIKPLFYYYDKDRFVFASELKTILQHPNIERKINLSALSDYISYQCIPAPETMFQLIKKLEPAHYLIIKDNQINIKKYWEVNFNKKIKISEIEAIDETFNYFKYIVKQHLISDVPIGLFLSGGIDSTLVTTAVKEITSKEIKTFSIGFDYEPISELKYSRFVAKTLETEHTEIILKPEVLNILPKLIEHYGEPFADSSAIPTYYISNETKKYVKVAIAGDGGDELFAGYEVFGQLNLIKNFNPLLTLFQPFIKSIKNIYGKKDSKRKIAKLLRFLTIISSNKNKIYPLLRCTYYNELKENLFNEKFKRRINIINSYQKYLDIFNKTNTKDFIEKMLEIDLKFTLPHLLLTKVDIASMANSLEVRVPFLDKRFVEFSASLPVETKIQKNTGKYILKKILKKYFPDDFIYRKKMGFSIPLNKWMCEEMKDYIKDILFSDTKINSTFFNEKYIEKLYKEHINKKEDNSATIWMLIILKLWINRFKVDYFF